MDDGPSEQAEAAHDPEPARIWKAVTRTVGFLTSNIPAFVLMTAVVLVPALLYQSGLLDHAEAGMSDEEYEEYANASAGLGGYYALLALLLQAATTLAVFQHLRGHPVRVFASIRRGLGALLPIILMAVLLLFLCCLAIGLVAQFVTLLMEGLDQEAALEPVSLGMALIVFVWICSCHLVCIQAIVVEKLGPIAAVNRSQVLTGGSRWRIASLLVLVFVVRWLLKCALYPAIIDPSASWDAFRLARYVDAGLNSLFVVFIATCGAVIYCDLRRAKDGIDVEELTRVFEG